MLEHDQPCARRFTDPLFLMVEVGPQPEEACYRGTHFEVHTILDGPSSDGSREFWKEKHILV